MGEARATDSDIGWRPSPERGWVAPLVAAEFPGLAISWIAVDARIAKSPEPVRLRLRGLSDRFYGANAIQMRQQTVPWAYRVFFRHIGLDPDRTLIPVERLALERLHDGAFKSRGLPRDALTIAIVETGVALRAFDAERVEGKLCIRESAPGESLAGKSGELAHGTLVIADDHAPTGLLFGETAEGMGVDRDTRRVVVVATQVKGVPQMTIDEALWMAAATIES